VTSLLDFHRGFLPFERAILLSVHNALPSPMAMRFAGQVGSINKIQRLLEWREIEFYSMRWFKVAWPEQFFFADRSEFRLARVTLALPSANQFVDVFSVGGHLFCLESDRPMKPLRRLEVTVASVEVPPEASRAAQPPNG
jgi:hypothetical protein